MMLTALSRCGVSTGAVTGSFTPPRILNDRIYRSTLGTDVYQGLGLAWATHQARGRYAPRAIMYSATPAVLYQPRAALRTPFAVRFDATIQDSRPGRRFAVEHVLERRRLRAARVLLPTALDVDPEIGRLLPRTVRTVPLPLPVKHLGGSEHREPTVVTYTGSPGKKGLDMIARAWHRTETGDRRLVVTGITAEAGRRYLNQCGIDEPEGIEWPGLVSHAEFRALTASAEIYVSASTYEAYGMAQLEALSDGALLVTLPSPGQFVALPTARRLAPGLVATDRSADALAHALTNAIALPETVRRRYRREAAVLVQDHSEEVLDERLRTQVLPHLLEA